MLNNKKFALGFICAGVVAIIAAIVVSINAPKPYYTNVPDALEAAVSKSLFIRWDVSMSDIEAEGQIHYYGLVNSSLKEQNEDFYMSELVSEWHKTLGIKKRNGHTEVYALCGMSGYGFRNGKFVNNCGYFVPTLLIFDKDKNGNYVLRSYKEAKDGADYTDSIREMFPEELVDQAVNAPSNPELTDSLEYNCDKCAEAYLASIGRAGTLGKLSDEDQVMLHGFGVSDSIEADLLDLHPEYGEYLGSIEKVESGVRYVYTVKWDGDDKGNGLVTYTKTEYETGSVVQRVSYKVEKGEKYTELKHKANKKK